MANPFVAEIRIFPFNFAPRGWATCDGQLISLSQNTALFSLLGTTYGGDGRSNFGLPKLQGSAPMHQGQGPGLSAHYLGEAAGTPTVTLLTSEMPQHAHTINCVNGRVNTQVSSPTNALLALAGPPGPNMFTSNASVNQFMGGNMVGPMGNSQPHNNMMPYLTLNFCIAMQGVFPARP